MQEELLFCTLIWFVFLFILSRSCCSSKDAQSFRLWPNYLCFENYLPNNTCGMIEMCGIFGFALKRPLSLVQVLNVLEKLEVHQYPNEPTTLGGYGAGIAILEQDGSIILRKVGKAGKASPAKQLAKAVSVSEASVLIGHVRMPSPEFMATARFNETAQPYIVQRDPKLAVASVHNGKVQNYVELRKKLGEAHVFESEKYELIDSEVIPHYFEELLGEKQEPSEALYSLFCALQGSSAIAMLQVSEESSFLHLVHKGKTRGLTVWTNHLNEVVFCSRQEPLIQELGNFLEKSKFKEKVSIGYHEDAGLKLSFPLVSW
jgi:glutamine phosphoribosylpyrophosphate amidotransferase